MKPNLCWTHWRKNAILFAYDPGYIYASFPERLEVCDLCVIERGEKNEVARMKSCCVKCGRCHGHSIPMAGDIVYCFLGAVK